MIPCSRSPQVLGALQQQQQHPAAVVLVITLVCSSGRQL
jgi:hypothetical protein